MGLRLVAHYFDRSEALIVRGALQAAGVAAFVDGFYLLTAYPFYEVTCHGYRIVVPEEDLADAVAILRQARANPLREGEALIAQRDVAFPVLAVVLFLILGIYLPLRGYEWSGAQGAPDIVT
jgi:hypothetical protein